jgi:hypothetical protein
MKKFILIVIFITCGCSDQITADRAAKLEARIAALEQASKPKLDLRPGPVPTNGFVPDFKPDVFDFVALSNEEYSISLDVLRLQLANSARRHMDLDPVDHSFHALETSSLTLLVALEDITPYLDGFKLHVKIGNPYNMTFDGCTVFCQWGLSGFGSNGIYNAKEWRDSQKSNTVEIATQLLSGCWTPAEVPVVPATTDELRQLRLSVDTKSVILLSKVRNP